MTSSTAVVTGGNSGVGLEVVRALAHRGYRVLVAARDTEKTSRSVRELDEGGASVQAVPLDLASLRSVARAADEILARADRIDLLVNNAGIMWAPPSETADGFEVHFGVNHLGHFALTQRLLPSVIDANGRVVVVTSPAHRAGRAPARALSGAAARPVEYYSDSKLANLLFAGELNRRLSGTGAIAVAAHPGSARTELNRTMPWFVRGRNWGLARPITHSAQAGAQSLLRAATDSSLHGGEYLGPGGWREFRGEPAILEPSAVSRDPAAQRELWATSERVIAESTRRDHGDDG
ncbi:oxidoreductase [Galbitalea sp. SE-J8]|uniref:oxidoreductase n=1 Tax=Galbitalea sp. SE-J8 TaxID=3054952 RepID=UPI00259C68F5|nr:oxidoreductase [Galbitalea sp. SE-J8]MDM4763667.1 oxidoreductase [Galbitalea sp. SE-J8]